MTAFCLVSAFDRLDLAWTVFPDFGDLFKYREPLEGLETPALMVSTNELREVPLELAVVVIGAAFRGCLLDRAVHASDLRFAHGDSTLVSPRSMPFSRQVLPLSILWNSASYRRILL
jgi:hypothetical protein